MARTYNVIDSDGHILEPLTLWKDYLDPAYRDRAPKLVIDSDGKERLLVEEQVLGSQQGMGGIGGVGARQGVVSSETMKSRKAGPADSTRISASPTWTSTASTPRSSTRAWGCSPARCTIPTSLPRCAAPTTAGLPTTASPTRTGSSA